MAISVLKYHLKCRLVLPLLDLLSPILIKSFYFCYGHYGSFYFLASIYKHLKINFGPYPPLLDFF